MSDTRPVTPETIEVKRRGRHRLIGAITLAVLAVVIIPMVLDSDPRKVGKELALSIPAKDGLAPLPAPAPESVKPASETPKSAPEEPAPASNAATRPESTPAKVPPKPTAVVVPESNKVEPRQADARPEPKAETKAETKISKPADKPADKPDTKPTAKAEGFAIQLGAFSDADKLAALKARMKSAKVTVFTEEVKTAGGKLTRLRAGPYKTREQADKALTQVKKAGVDGKVIPLP